MDNQKIGLFIANERKALNFTQSQLARKLHVSEKTISKWENGRGLPDTSLLLDLCSIFSISLNELLSGERIDKENYRERAESNMTALLMQRKSNKRKFIISALLVAVAFSVSLLCVALASFLMLPVWLRVCLIVYGGSVCVFGIIIAAINDVNVGSFECRYCGARFVPTMKAYVFSYHTFTKRRLKCPRCGQIGMFKKSMQNKDDTTPLL